MTDAENPHDQYAFDNPCFREATPIKHNIHDEKPNSKLEKNKWLGWTPLHSFAKENKNEKVSSMDDSLVNDSRLKVVTLKSHDFTGLGFNICGNMRDGIFVKDVLHRGPAFESGCINPGDRIDSVCINFRNMVFEDALTILSYASPYDVQVQVESDSYSRPSTLIRSKRESNAVSSTERIRHPKYNRSQSISNLNEIGKTNNKKAPHQIEFMHEKNRINQSLNKSQEYHGSPNDYPTIKLSPSTHQTRKENQKLEKNAMSKISPMGTPKKSSSAESKEKSEPDVLTPGDSSPNKHQKFGIKVLPISINPKMGVQSVTGTKKPNNNAKNLTATENEINTIEKPEKPEKPIKLKLDMSNRSSSLSEDTTNISKKDSPGIDEPDTSKENVKTMLTKGLQNLKEKINQNTLGKKRSKDTVNESNVEGEINDSEKKNNDVGNVTVTVKKGSSEERKPTMDSAESDWPVPKLRSTVACGVKAYEQNQQSHSQTYITLPEEVSRAGDVARNNRKSLGDPAKNSSSRPESSVVIKPKEEKFSGESVEKEKNMSGKSEAISDSESSSDREDSSRTSGETKKPKRSKGKAPPPPGSSADLSKSSTIAVSNKPSTLTSKEINEIKKESELPKDEKTNIFEPVQSDTRTISLNEDIDNSSRRESTSLVDYDSDSDTEPRTVYSKDRPSNTKIELNATQVTIHQSPSSDGNDDDIEPSRKAASLGDLSKLDSEQPLSVVLERAVSLDLADGTTQCGKKRKAPLPPPEEFPAVFENLSYRKEPRLDNSLGPNTFQRRLKKSSDFGTLEDALYDGPKSLEIEVNKLYSPLDLTETHNTNIQEFSSWLAECRRPKQNKEGTTEESQPTRPLSSTSLVNINSTDYIENDNGSEDNKPQYEYQGSNVSFSVNGKNFPDFHINDKISMETQSVNFPGTNSKTVVVISQPSSLEPTILETVPVNYTKEEESFQKTPTKESPPDSLVKTCPREEESSSETLVTTNESQGNKFRANFIEEDETPPQLPTSPMPAMSSSSTLSSPLSSSFTYITEIKVSTSGGEENDSQTSKLSDISSPSRDSQNELESQDIVSSTPISVNRKLESSSNSISEKIQKFDKPLFHSKEFISPVKMKSSVDGSMGKKDNDFTKKETHTIFESSKIPIKTMKSETGQKVLATIQSLAAKESSPPKSSEAEYAKRVASLFSGNSLERNLVNVRKQTEIMENEISRPNISGFYLKSPGTSPPKPSKDFSPTRKVPPVVPPRKMETSLTNKSTFTVELTGKNMETNESIVNENSVPSESQERNIVTFSSFMPKTKNDDSNNMSRISFNVKEHGEINGGHLHGHDNVVPIKTSATKIIFESKDSENDF